MATSSKAKRRWGDPGDGLHHLVDPRTGTPSSSDLAAATVVAGTCWQAEAFAKAAVVAGSSAGIDLLEAAGVEGVLVDGVGDIRLTVGIDAYFEPTCSAA